MIVVNVAIIYHESEIFKTGADGWRRVRPSNDLKRFSNSFSMNFVISCFTVVANVCNVFVYSIFI